jgi:hypothetical protein
MLPVRWLNTSDFNDLVTVHNANLAGLKAWRTKFGSADFVDPMAKFLNDGAKFVGAPHPGEAVWKKLLTTNAYAGSADVFDPWTSWWAGPWNRGAVQYHIWDGTEVNAAGQYVQPVTQSETAHVSKKNFKYMNDRGLVNTAINVYRAGDGVTGWVTKRQGETATMQLPHLGYSLPDYKLLVWFAQKYAAAGTGAVSTMTTETSFYLFLEWVDSTKYHVRGCTVTVKDKAVTGTSMGTGADYSAFMYAKGIKYTNAIRETTMPDPAEGFALAP